MGFNEKNIYDTSKYVGAKSKNLNIDKLRKSKVNFNLKDLDDGIFQVVEWYKNL